MGKMRTGCKILIARPEGKRQLGRPRRRWEDNIKMDIREIVLEAVNWINLTQDRDWWQDLANTVTHFRVA
jgi:hypothetical protein